jgi:hypothetical protein
MGLVISKGLTLRNGSTTIIDSSPTDHLSIPASRSLQVGADDFTVEAWVYLLGNRTFNHIVSKGGQNAREWALNVGPSNISFYWSTNGLSLGDSSVSRSATLPLNEWMHIAAVKSGTTIKIFKDGVQQGSDGAFTSIFSGNGTFWVGRFMDFGQISHSLNGHLDDLRITKGVARYTANFTPPTAPFADAQF